jgi:cyclase
MGPLEAARVAEDFGAGEVVLQSMDRDGTMSGFDLATIRSVSASLSIPVVALGGAGEIIEFEDLFRQTYVNGIAAGSFFVFQGKHRGVLIRYPPIKDYNFD